ncbi:hypothetical protein J5U23_01408 [Saccharolobus shibatae B12]|uniref:Uncharacterized protein n=1 Tax=Saccharolobus shibatae (strain ATCC 51178 / DSM 5389 / JCM 8931 / NBRC 15437 / B12) TaxID=523848 RepID=A0A8F5BNP8_SACSH|nr:hypothetical protein [Saccharolobus shibatae]QXJ28539.1 hypothetical protein J5U23_01408 [Saccharolobus shibatae B12]
MDYKVSVIFGIVLLILSALEPNFALIAYFYLVFGVISSVIQNRFTVRKEYYLSLISLLLPLLHNYTIPSIILSLEFGMFFP